MFGLGLFSAGPRVLLDPTHTSANLEDISAAPTNAATDFRVDSDGQIYYREGLGAFVVAYVWMQQGANTEYQTQLTVDAGTTPTGSATATWIDTTSDVTWSLSQVIIGIKSGTYTVRIRDKSTTELLASMTLTMYAEEA